LPPRAAADRYDALELRWQAGVEWSLLWIENTANQLTADGGPATR
jgi:hypothetical protein